MELYYKSILFEILAKPFAKRNKRKQDLIKQISEKTIHQIIIAYYKSRLVPANFLKRLCCKVVTINTPCQRDDSGYKSAKKKKWTAQNVLTKLQVSSRNCRVP